MQIDKMVVVPADKFISVNDEGYQCPAFTAEPHKNYGPVHAIHWSEFGGYIEYSRGPAIGFTNKADLDPYLKIWQETKAKHLRAAHADVARNVPLIEKHINEVKDSVRHVTDQLNQIDKHLKTVDKNDPQTASMLNSRTVLANHLEHLKSQVTLHQGRLKEFVTHEKLTNTAATQAEKEV